MENGEPLPLYLAPTLSRYHQISICSTICEVTMTGLAAYKIFIDKWLQFILWLVSARSYLGSPDNTHAPYRRIEEQF